MKRDRGYGRSARAAQRRTAGEVMRGGGAKGGRRAARRAERRSARQALRDDPQLRSRAEDFVHRYTAGDPRQGYDDREAAEMFEFVRANSTPQELQEALQATVRNLPREQQEQVARMLHDQAGEGSGSNQRMGIGGSGGGLGDLLGGLLGGGVGAGMMGGPMGGMAAGVGSASASPLGALLGGLIGTAGHPMPTPYQRSDDPITSLLGGLLGGGSGPLAQQPMMGGMMGSGKGGGLGGMLGGLLGGSSGTVGGHGSGQPDYGQQAGSDPMGGLLKTILGGMAAHAMQKMLSGR